MQLAGKVAVITGAARGLGRAYAEALAAEGAAIVAADLNDCSDTVAAVESAGGRAVHSTVDVSDAASCEAMASTLIALSIVDQCGARCVAQIDLELL